MPLKRIARFIADHQLLNAEHTHLVALSGGADSVALLLTLRELGYRIEAIHCNFHLRGEESDRDEAFCANLCEQQNIPFHRVHFDTKTYAALHHVSIEMAARELRYNYFEQLRNDIDADSICVGHHKDDLVETVIMNLIRGTGLQGLTGISPRNGHVVRPLLNISHVELVDYLKMKHQDFVTDSSNLVDDVVRNKVRLHLIPLLEDINPAASDHIANTAEYLSQVRDFANGQAEEILSKSSLLDGGIQLSSFDSIEGRNFLIYYALHDKDFTSTQIAEVNKSLAESGKIWTSNTHECTIDRGKLYVRQIPASFKTMKMPEPGVYQLTDGRKCHIVITDRQPDFTPSKDAWHVTLDADEVTFPLTIRTTVQGDRFNPYGMKGSKLVSDYLTDKKRNLFEKKDQLVITDAKDKVVWLVGERIADGCKVKDSTQKIMYLSIDN